MQTCCSSLIGSDRMKDITILLFGVAAADECSNKLSWFLRMPEAFRERKCRHWNDAHAPRDTFPLSSQDVSAFTPFLHSVALLS